jgi:hypothetical protein
MYVGIKEKVKCQHPVTRITPMLLPYQSCAGAATGTLQLHVQCLIWDMRHFKLPSHLDCTMEVDVIIATDGSVLFWVGYYSWLITTMDEYINMAGGRPDDGSKDQMASYQSELGGKATVIRVLGTLLRSGIRRTQGVTLICYSSAAVLTGKRDLTPSVFHRTEIDFDLIATIKYLEKEWRGGIIISYSLVRGHAYCLDQPLTKNERLNIEADAIADQIRIEARGPCGARPQCNHWELYGCPYPLKGSSARDA